MNDCVKKSDLDTCSSTIDWIESVDSLDNLKCLKTVLDFDFEDPDYKVIRDSRCLSNYSSREVINRLIDLLSGCWVVELNRFYIFTPYGWKSGVKEDE